MTWLEKLGFEEDPYRKWEPFDVPEDKIVWNRADWEEIKENTIEPILKKVESQYGVSLLVHGYFGSGKTWLCRYISIAILERVREISKKEPLIFKARLQSEMKGLKYLFKELMLDLQKKGFFDNLKKYLNESKDRISDELKLGIEDETRKGEIIDGEVKARLKTITKNSELAQAFFNFWKGDKEKRETTWLWLCGETVPIGDLRDCSINSKIDSDYDRFKILSALINTAKEMYPTIVLILDELKNVAYEDVGRTLSEYLRELMDEHYERFVLLCTFTSEILDKLYDLGYTAAFTSRLDDIIKTDTLEIEAALSFLREHQRVYRKRTTEIKDQLYPFSEDGIKKLVEIIKPERKVPRNILTNCGRLAERLVDTKAKLVDETFVVENYDILKADDLSDDFKEKMGIEAITEIE